MTPERIIRVEYTVVEPHVLSVVIVEYSGQNMMALPTIAIDNL